MNPSDKRQLNLSLTEDEYEQINEMADRTGLEKKELILQSIKKNQERLSNEDPDPHVTEEVKACMESANGLFGFRMDGLIRDLENHGLQWIDLSEADQALILGRYKEHASYWGHSSSSIKEDLSRLAKALGIDTKVLLRRYYALGAEAESSSGDEASDESNDTNQTGQRKGKLS